MCFAVDLNITYVMWTKDNGQKYKCCLSVESDTTDGQCVRIVNNTTMLKKIHVL